MSARVRVVTGDHAFAGWKMWEREPFDDKAGPFFHRVDERGRLIAAMKADHSHLNGMDVVHGGCLITLADYSMFTIAAFEQDTDDFVTISLNSEFVGAARRDDLIIARPEIVRRGRRIVFARGVLVVGERPVLTFSGTMMRAQKESTSIPKG
jgi:uncharacterized protein (TIGR00369 family)